MSITKTEKIIIGLIIFLLILTGISFGVLCHFAGKAAKEIDSKGIKGVSEQLWYGSKETK